MVRKILTSPKCLSSLIISLVLLTFLTLYINSIKRYPVWWWFLPYERRLCDNAPVNNQKQEIKLVCYYIFRNVLFRYQIEELHTNPDLLIIRRFCITKKEIDFIINGTRTFSEPSPVYTLLTSTEFEENLMTSLDFRTSRSFEFLNFELPSLYKKAELATGLNVSNLDGWFNVLWYIKYGHIIPHHDVYPYSDSVTDGRRFATLIIYFYEPDEGGATIFPNLGIAVKPNVGDGILFYNTKVDNQPDPFLSHAGCPVWKGEKFIGTFWFRAFHQEFRKPCPLIGDRYSFS